MNFYKEMTTDEQKNYYCKMLEMMGSLSNLFSESPKPYLVSRVTENLFCRCLEAENLSRSDVTADAKKNSVGIGIKTWVGSNLQKIAEFNSLKKTYENDNDRDMIFKIANYRNERINFTLRTYDLEKMIYHCTIRDDGIILVKECPLVPIDVEHIRNINRNENSIHFDDGINEYSFNSSKSTLYKRFDDLVDLEKIFVKIIEDPFEYLAEKMGYSEKIIQTQIKKFTDSIYLGYAIIPLYSEDNSKGRYVPEKNNLNMRFASGRKRNEYEIGFPIPATFRRKCPDFFPGVDYSFRLILPDGKEISAKQCQQDGKSLMSNPNSALGEWFIDKVLKISPSVTITYEMLEKYGIDSMKLCKYKNLKSGEIFYTIDFALSGSYENFMDGTEI